MNQIIVTHGGVGSPPKYKDGTEKAAQIGMELLREGKSALDAVEAAIIVMEDDERFNAGKGSFMRLDGTIEMDALLMDSEGNCGGVAAIREVKNPIAIARKVMESPHLLMVGDGAIEFARRSDFNKYDPTTKKAIKKLSEVKKKLKMKNLPDWAVKWKDFEMSETVGAVAMDVKGGFASGNSSGGVSIAMKGRVGDSPLVGCGAFAGEHGAVTATGIGEEIMRTVLSKSVYDRLMEGKNPQKACEWGLGLFEQKMPIGVLAVSKEGYGVAASKEMSWSAL